MSSEDGQKESPGDIHHIHSFFLYQTILELSSSFITSWVDLNKVDIIEQSCISRYVTVTCTNQYNNKVFLLEIHIFQNIAVSMGQR